MTTTHDDAPALIDPDRAAALLTAVQRGDDGAFQDLVRLCEPMVRRQASRYAWRREAVDDVVQEVWLSLLVHADQIREPRSLFAWLGVVTRRSAMDLGHREARLVPSRWPTSWPVRTRPRTRPCDATTAPRSPTGSAAPSAAWVTTTAGSSSCCTARTDRSTRR